MSGSNTTSSDHGSAAPGQSVDAIFAELDVQDGNIHIGFAMRDKLRPYDQPTVLTVDTIDAVIDFLGASPDQVHYLMLAKDGKRGLIKLSYSARSGKYNVQSGKLSLLGKTLDMNFLSGIADQLAPELWSGLLTAFSKQECI